MLFAWRNNETDLGMLVAELSGHSIEPICTPHVSKLSSWVATPLIAPPTVDAEGFKNDTAACLLAAGVSAAELP